MMFRDGKQDLPIPFILQPSSFFLSPSVPFTCAPSAGQGRGGTRSLPTRTSLRTPTLVETRSTESHSFVSIPVHRWLYFRTVGAKAPENRLRISTLACHKDNDPIDADAEGRATMAGRPGPGDVMMN
jgi:hypothetical protein